MRRVFIALISLFVAAGITPATADDAERRLPRIQVTALPPHMGTVYANAFTVRPQIFERPGYNAIEIRFFPMIFDESGNIKPDTADPQVYSISTKIPPRAEGAEFIDSVRDFYTQDIALPSGPYVISEITFHADANGRREKVTFCLSDGTLLFEIIGRDTLFLGRLQVDYPPESEAERNAHTPLQSMGEGLKAVKGWRWTTRDLLHFDVRTLAFQPEAVCSLGSIQTAAWAGEATSRAYSPSP